jgi:hypothetical protein
LKEQNVLSRKKEAEIIYERLRDPNDVQVGSAAGSAGEMDYSVIVNDHTSTDAEGEPDTTTSAPPVASEKANGENTQKNENHGEDNAEVNVSPALEVSSITHLSTQPGAQGLALHKENDELQVSDLIPMLCPEWL